MNLPTARPSHLSRFVTHVAIIAAAVLGSASTLFAQDRMFVLLLHSFGLDIDAGSASGLSNLAVSHGLTGTEFTANGIPPGRYFVRVRAINWVGRSLPSNEVEVVVP